MFPLNGKQSELGLFGRILARIDKALPLLSLRTLPTTLTPVSASSANDALIAVGSKSGINLLDR